MLSKYELIKQDLIAKIESYEYKPNQILPSESALCEQYQVSRITVRRAIEELTTEKKLYKIRGKGCFVRENHCGSLSRIYSFSEAIRKSGKTPHKKQLNFTVEPASEQEAEKLWIKAGDSVYRIRSLYLADEEKYCISQSVLPVAIFPRLEAFNWDNCSLYEILQSFYSLQISRVKQNLRAIAADVALQKELDLKDAKPLLCINAVSYCLDQNMEKPFELYESFILTDVMTYTTEKFNL